MKIDFFAGLRASALLLTAVILLPGAVSAEPQHGMAMYGEPALPPDYESFQYVDPEAPKGGRVVEGNAGTFDSLNPFIVKGQVPWQLRFLTHESLMIRNWDEPFTVYGLLAESVVTGPNRQWVEFTLRDEATFTDGSPVTVEDVIWSYEILGTEGNARYRGLATQIESVEATGPRSVRITFNTEDRELAMLAGLRPILKKSQYEGRDFTSSDLGNIPMGTGPYVIDSYNAGRSVTLKRDPDYWATDLPAMRGQANFDEIRIEFFGDDNVLFEAFKAGEIDFVRVFNAERWERDFDFPAVKSGDVVLTEVPSQRPTGITGFVMNTRRPPFDDIRVRDAMLHAFNFPYINDVLTGGKQPRITSYFSNSELGMRDGPAEGSVAELLAPFADTIPAAAIEGYALPQGDERARNRGDIRTASRLLDQAGWIVENGVRMKDGKPLRFDVLLRQGDQQSQLMLDIYQMALERLGVQVRITTVDDAQYNQRIVDFDFDMTDIRRQMSLSPGNDQKLYWGSDTAHQPGSRNLMGVESPAIDAMIDAMLQSRTAEEFTAATRALDRLLTSGIYVIPIFSYDMGRIAHRNYLDFAEDRIPIYGDSVYWMPGTWWDARAAQ